MFASSFRPHLLPLALTPGSTGQSLRGYPAPDWAHRQLCLYPRSIIESFFPFPDTSWQPVLRLRLFFSSVASFLLCASFPVPTWLSERSMILSLPCKDSRGSHLLSGPSLLVAPPAPPVSPLSCAERERMRAKWSPHLVTLWTSLCC